MGWNLLSDEDVRIVQMLIDREKRRLETEDIQEQEEFDGDYITDHHLVYIPTGGLPAWDGQTGTGTNSLDLFQECEVYRPADDLDEADVEEAGFTLIVHNPYLTDIEGDQFVTVTKDKFGRWYPTSLGGSGLVEPSVYVVRVPTGGINALNTNTTTGTSPEGDLDDDIVDYAQCEVFQLLEPCSEEARFVSKGFTVCVHNLGYCHIEGGRFIRALRDEYGVWWADEPSCEDPRPFIPDPWTGTGTGDGITGTGTGDGDPGIPTACGNAPATLYGHIEMDGCGTGWDVTLTYSVIDDKWVGSVVIGACCVEAPTEPLSIELTCAEGNVWSVHAAAPTQEVLDEVTVTNSSDPFQVTMTGNYFCNPNTYPFTIVITETPP